MFWHRQILFRSTTEMNDPRKERPPPPARAQPPTPGLPPLHTSPQQGCSPALAGSLPTTAVSRPLLRPRVVWAWGGAVREGAEPDGGVPRPCWLWCPHGRVLVPGALCACPGLRQFLRLRLSDFLSCMFKRHPSPGGGEGGICGVKGCVVAVAGVGCRGTLRVLAPDPARRYCGPNRQSRRR